MKKKTIAVKKTILILFLMPLFYGLQAQQDNAVAGLSKKSIPPLVISKANQTTSPNPGQAGIYAVVTGKVSDENGKGLAGVT
ncbi:MAG: hypothetical protein ABUT20_64680, partial [Bacteroidota bacterium]